MSALTLSVLGMMLVIGGVLATGLFLPGVLLIGLSLIAYAAAGVLHALGPHTVREEHGPVRPVRHR